MMLRLLVLTALLALAAAIPARVPMLDGRIVGGESVTIDQHPYQASLQFFGSHICGCSIIADRWALTAAHCTDGSSAGLLSVRVGSSDRGSGGQVIKVKRVIQHVNYNSRIIDYDISLLELSSVASGAVSINLVDQEIANGTRVVVTGWGTTSEGGSLPIKLQKVEVNMITRQACRNAYGSGSITDRMICAGGQGGKDSCQGDSGGPLAVAGSNLQPGVVSWGYGCARPGYPGVYSNVANLRGWIKNNSGV